MTKREHYNGINTIIWDWNGTLLDDVDICIKSINILLQARGLPLLDKKRYLEIFTFPVKEYYRKAGFDFSVEPFETPASEFMSLYYNFLPEADLFPCAGEVLQQLKDTGYRLVVVSAMEHDSLVQSLKDKRIYHYFQGVYGINDIYAHSKTEVARAMFSELGFQSSQCLMAGDTLHDLEVAEALGVRHLLVASGHQSAGRLTARTANVVRSLKDVATKLLN